MGSVEPLPRRPRRPARPRRARGVPALAPAPRWPAPTIRIPPAAHDVESLPLERVRELFCLGVRVELDTHLPGRVAVPDLFLFPGLLRRVARPALLLGEPALDLGLRPSTPSSASSASTMRAGLLRLGLRLGIDEDRRRRRGRPRDGGLRAPSRAASPRRSRGRSPRRSSRLLAWPSSGSSIWMRQLSLMSWAPPLRLRRADARTSSPKCRSGRGTS